MERVFERRYRLVNEQVSFSASIYEREEGDESPQAVQVCFYLDGVVGVQSGMTFYVADPVELHALAEQFKHAAVALTYAKKYDEKIEAEAA